VWECAGRWTLWGFVGVVRKWSRRDVIFSVLGVFCVGIVWGGVDSSGFFGLWVG